MIKPVLDLSDKFLSDDIAIGELEAVIHQCFREVCEVSENEVIYFDQDAMNYGIRIEYQGAKIVSVHRGPDLSNGKLDFLLSKINSALLEDNGRAIGGSILFNIYPTEGFFRYGDLFQLRPVSLDSPRPDAVLADHPCVLEVSFKNSSDIMVSNIRGGSKITEVGLLLHILLEGAIKIKPRIPSFHWVLIKKDPSKDKRLAYCQEWYTTSDMPVNTSEFTNNKNWKPLEAIDSDRYYNSSSIRQGSLQVPADLSISIRKFYQLDEQRMSVFLRACRWALLSAQITNLSPSASFVAKVIAIESLLPKQTVKGFCPSCNQAIKESTSKIFRNFIEEFAPDSAVPPRFKKELYRVRSKIVHGLDLLSADFLFEHLAFNPAAWIALEQNGALNQTVKIIMHNWLLAH